MSTYRFKPEDEEGADRDVTLSELTDLLRAQHHHIPYNQWLAFTTVHPELAHLFKSNGD